VLQRAQEGPEFGREPPPQSLPEWQSISREARKPPPPGKERRSLVQIELLGDSLDLYMEGIFKPCKILAHFINFFHHIPF
jgi:hypothetical protein